MGTRNIEKDHVLYHSGSGAVDQELEAAMEAIAALRIAAYEYLKNHPDTRCRRCTEGGSGIEWYDACELHGVLDDTAWAAPDNEEDLLI